MIENQLLTVQEQSAMKLFKEQLGDLDLGNNPLFEDRRLINWLRARDLNIDAAEKMLRKHLVWRMENDIDTILISHNIPQELVDIVPAEVVGSDKDGNSVLGICCAQLDFRKVIEKYGKHMTVKLFYFMLETAYADVVLKSTNQKVMKRVNLISDNDDIRIKDYISPSVVEVLVTVLKAVEANYPELLNKAYIINVPLIYPMLWNIVKPFLAPKTIEKVHVIGHDLSKIEKCLFNQIPEFEIPRKWGGTGFSTRMPQLNVTNVEKNYENVDSTQVTIPPGDVFEVKLDVKSHVIIRWSFKTSQYDIGFSVTHTSNKKRESGVDQKPTEVMLGYKRLNTHKIGHCGSLSCNQPGEYCLKFDNTYSRLREKVLTYNVSMTPVLINGNLEN